MNEKNGNQSDLQDAPRAVVKTRKQISIVWLVPVVALAIGGWLAYKAITEKGPTITITFETAEGLEAGKTKIKYKDVEIGKVETIDVSPDLSHIIATAELFKGAEQYLTEKTQFWVVRARVAAGKVSALGTLFSGAYIGMDPGKSGAPQRKFKGLEVPPVVTTDLPGRHFVLRSQRLWSLDVGSPIYYRQIKVGQVVSYELEKDNKTIRFQVFINAPHHELVYKNTKFWNAGGVDVTLDADGIRIRTEALVAILLGGIAFDIPPGLDPGDPAEMNEVFKLFANQEDILEKKTTELNNFILEFKGSVRGLSVGAPVELRGIKLGEVTKIRAEFDQETMSPRILVFIQTDPDAFKVVGKAVVTPKDELEQMVAKGLRAQLQTGSLLTGQLFVDVDFFPDAPPAKINYDGIYPQLPTVPARMEMLRASVTHLLNKLEKLPIDEIGNSLLNTVRNAEKITDSAELKQAIANLNQTLKNTNQFTADFNKKITPQLNSAMAQLNATLKQADKTLADAGSVVNPDSSLYRQLNRAMKELADAAQSIRALAEYLERHPDALIYGKGKR
jgi:paraquat-inducible protein B